MDHRLADADPIARDLRGRTCRRPAPHMLRENLADRETTDFQHWAPWRSLVVTTAAELARFTGQHLICPQTSSSRRIWTRSSAASTTSAGTPVTSFSMPMTTPSVDESNAVRKHGKGVWTADAGHDECYFGLWEGWAQLHGSPTVSRLGSAEHVPSVLSADELRAHSVAAPSVTPDHEGVLDHSGPLTALVSYAIVSKQPVRQPDSQTANCPRQWSRTSKTMRCRTVTQGDVNALAQSRLLDHHPC
jgi:hypothetical protein